jgi:hypothetical protein
MFNVQLTTRQLELMKLWLDCSTFNEFKRKSGADASEIYQLIKPFEQAKEIK